MLIAPQLIPTPQIAQVIVSVEPAYNPLLSMFALIKPDHYGGLEGWTNDTVRHMGADLHERHAILLKSAGIEGLINVVTAVRPIAEFPEFLDTLDALDPVVLRDGLWHWLFFSPHWRVHAETTPMEIGLIENLLDDYDQFAQAVQKMYGKDQAKDDLYPVHELYNDPERFKQELSHHLRFMWDEYVQPEWERILPRIEESARAFQALPLDNLTILDAIDLVTNRDLRFAFSLEELFKFRAVRFIPNPHHGPYIFTFGNEHELRLSFPPRIPSLATARGRHSFDHTSLANRYKALGDEIRLRILAFVREAEEVSTQEIIDAFDLDKSAASRHLRQLVATNLLAQRREDGAKKVYRLNGTAVDEIIEMLKGLK